MRIWLSVAADIIRACQMRTQQVEYRCSTDSVCDLMYPILHVLGIEILRIGTDAKFSTGIQ